MKVGLIGYGKWGKTLLKKLTMRAKVRFVITSSGLDLLNDKAIMNDVEWVFIATPDHTHEHIVRKCLSKGVNVFCEKPLTILSSVMEELYQLADYHKVHLYVDDVYNYSSSVFKLGSSTTLIRRTKSGGGTAKSLLSRLAYHDIYKLYPLLTDHTIADIYLVKLTKTSINFWIMFGTQAVNFHYDCNSEERKHVWNNVSVETDEDILTNMLLKVISDSDTIIQNNKKISSFATEVVEQLHRELFPSVAVVGAGIFGCTAAWKLASAGFSVALYEKNSDIMGEASRTNQYRLHRGFHYPRSPETALTSKSAESTFIKTYGESLLKDQKITHEYCIASENSMVTSDEYLEFCDSVGLDYEVIDSPREGCDLVVKVDENLFNDKKLKELCSQYLSGYGVDLKLSQQADKSILKKYDHVVVATYSTINDFLPKDAQRDYQFELCEKPIVLMPKEYKNKSVVIMDGPFMCIDPYGDTQYHVLGNVVHAIHDRYVGKHPRKELLEKYKDSLNKGCVETPEKTNISEFKRTGEKFFPNMSELQHIGSMFTYRVVLPNREHDDARPTELEHIGDKLSVVFSGKIGTCVDVADKLVERLSEKHYET
tara:strand:+ start:1302 stop:3092 length:1791 start_codon:yes stop_codon:yes gene_type:complete